MVLASPPCRVFRISPPPAGFVDHQVKNSTFHIPDQHNTTVIDSYHMQKQIEPAGKVWEIWGCLLPFFREKSENRKYNYLPRISISECQYYYCIFQGALNFVYLKCKVVKSDKTKAVWVRRRFSQKRNERICFVCCELQKSKQNKFVCSFFGESMAHQSAFGIIWHLEICNILISFNKLACQIWKIDAALEKTGV